MDTPYRLSSTRVLGSCMGRNRLLLCRGYLNLGIFYRVLVWVSHEIVDRLALLESSINEEGGHFTQLHYAGQCHANVHSFGVLAFFIPNWPSSVYGLLNSIQDAPLLDKLPTIGTLITRL